MFATALHHHHTGEDNGLWPLLMSRADAAGRELLEAMEAEHGEIDPILQACAAGFARLAERPDADARAALVVRLVAGRESLARHLAHEETDAITLIQQVMTDAEWRQVEDDYFKSQPIPPKLILKMLPWMFDKLPARSAINGWPRRPCCTASSTGCSAAATNAPSDGPSATPPEPAAWRHPLSVSHVYVGNPRCTQETSWVQRQETGYSAWLERAGVLARSLPCG